jgi:hypothetical protein
MDSIQDKTVENGAKLMELGEDKQTSNDKNDKNNEMEWREMMVERQRQKDHFHLEMDRQLNQESPKRPLLTDEEARQRFEEWSKQERQRTLALRTPSSSVLQAKNYVISRRLHYQKSRNVFEKS